MLRLLGKSEFNHLTIILTLPLTCELILSLNEGGPTCEIFNFLIFIFYKWKVEWR